MLLLAALGGCGGGGKSAGAAAPTPGAPVSEIPVAPAPITPEVPTLPVARLFNVPQHFPAPKIPADNPLSDAKIRLGQRLFFDRNMSINQARSCADCHQPALAFTDGKALAVGITDSEIHARNAMSLANLAYNAGFNWANPNLTQLEVQAKAVLFNEHPIELGWSDHEAQMLAYFSAQADYQEAFFQAFGEREITLERLIKALAAYQRALISGDSAYDRHLQGKTGALSEAALLGMNLFFSERLECFHCHGGFNLSQSVDHQGISTQQLEFFNNGLYHLNSQGAYPADNTGLFEFTQKPEDMGKFRPPSLRNIALTAPYMHDGSLAHLRDVIAHYARAGRLITDGPLAGDGANNPHKSVLLAGFVVSPTEVDALMAFFDSLTDWTFLCSELTRDPFQRLPQHAACGQRP